MVPSDFYLIKRFEVMQVEKDGKLIEKLVKPGTSLRYATFDEVGDTVLVPIPDLDRGRCEL